MTQFEFYKSIQFVLELLAAESLFATRLFRRSYFPLRLFAAVLLTFLFAYLLPVPSANAFWTSFFFFALFVFTVFMAKFLFKEEWLKLIFCLLAGYTVQHLSYELYNLALVVMGVSASGTSGFYGDQTLSLFPNAFIGIVYFYIYIVTYFFCWLLFGRKLERGEQLRLKNWNIFVFVILILIIDIILNTVVMYHLGQNAGKLYLAIVGIYNILCCLIVLFLQFEVSLRQRLEDTLRTVEHLRHQEKEQYESSKENIELINMKCHDLKHQIRMIGQRSSINEASVKEIESLISIYDSTVHTGNPALDLILTEKSLLCNKNGIRFSLIVDGKRLAFMREEEIYSLFGNLIDNAIEAAMPLPEEKRIISLRVRQTGNMLSIGMRNFFERELVFRDGVPWTTKSEKEWHGYGLKSVRNICDKYGGDLSINAQDGVFTVNILFSIAHLYEEHFLE